MTCCHQSPKDLERSRCLDVESVGQRSGWGNLKLVNSTVLCLECGSIQMGLVPSPWNLSNAVSGVAAEETTLSLRLGDSRNRTTRWLKGVWRRGLWSWSVGGRREGRPSEVTPAPGWGLPLSCKIMPPPHYNRLQVRRQAVGLKEELHKPRVQEALWFGGRRRGFAFCFCFQLSGGGKGSYTGNHYQVSVLRCGQVGTSTLLGGLVWTVTPYSVSFNCILESPGSFQKKKKKTYAWDPSSPNTT